MEGVLLAARLVLALVFVVAGLANLPPRAPKLVLISGGTEEQARALGLRAPILLDEMGATARAYGANGTPMAVLVDATGRIASKLVGGAPGCLALAGFRPTVPSV